MDKLFGGMTKAVIDVACDEMHWQRRSHLRVMVLVMTIDHDLASWIALEKCLGWTGGQDSESSRE